MKPLTYVAVDTAALQHNLRQVRALLKPETALLAVVKANGYGHGLVLAGRAFAKAGADWLGVSLLEEGIALREAGLTLPVLVLLPFAEDQAPALVEHNLTGTVVSERQLTALARAGDAAQREGHFEFFLDSGLGRPGVGEDLPRLMELAAGFPYLALEGVYTHLDAENAGGGLLEMIRPGTELHLLASTARNLAGRSLGRRLPVHAAASALTILRPEAHLDMVRVGTLLYGQYPGAVPAEKRTLELRSALELRSTIVGVSQLPAGAPVGYGGEFRCRCETRVALLPVGYAAGLGTVPESLARRRHSGLRGCARRILRREGEAATIAGQPAPLLGRLAMDWCCLDVTDLPEAVVGTEVVLPARLIMLDSGLPRVAV